MISIRACPSAMVVAAALLVTPAQAREPFEGVWARTDRECRDDEGPNSRLLVDLGSKAGPLADRYERHCKILDRENAGRSVRVTLRCHEFWEDYQKNKDGVRSAEIWSVQSATRMMINGKSYVRCIR
ncbi:hypothetical protein R1A27_04690 [Methylobacterium sp. NMS12]|uniref:hypothetical protein n=1 Tax=Methylobacterium sp. NMS12 TaxID=3079766 RepID=UPI003F880573